MICNATNNCIVTVSMMTMSVLSLDTSISSDVTTNYFKWENHMSSAMYAVHYIQYQKSGLINDTIFSVK